MKNKITKRIIRKIILSFVVITVGILSYTSTLDLLLDKIYIGELDNKGQDYFNSTLKRAIYTFAIARGINGVISVIQGTELSGAPGGVGVKFAVGEILDPINDLIERFSWVMLISTTSIGIQKMLLEMGKWFGFKILVCLSMFIILFGLWIPRISSINLLSLGYKIIIISIVIRFCIPAVALVSEKVYDLFLKDTYIESTKSLVEIKSKIKYPDLVDNKSQTIDPGFWENFLSKYEELKESVNIKRRLSLLSDTVSNSVKYIINLIVVFVLQTVLIPVIVLWALIKLTNYLFKTNITKSIDQKLKDFLISDKKLTSDSTTKPVSI